MAQLLSHAAQDWVTQQISAGLYQIIWHFSRMHSIRYPTVSTTLQYILRSDNPEKIPDSAECTSGGASHPACAPGFFEMDPPYQPPPPSARSALSPDTAELSAVAQTSSSWRGSNFTDDNVLSAGRCRLGARAGLMIESEGAVGSISPNGSVPISYSERTQA